MKHDAAQSLGVRHKSLLSMYVKIDELLQKIRIQARKEAAEWIRTFCPSITTHSSQLPFNDSTAYQQENHDIATRNKSIITTFIACYNRTWHFLKSYLYEKHSIAVSSPDLVFTQCLEKRIISTEEAQKLLTLVDSIDDLCHLYNHKGHHIISTDLVDYYNHMHTIIHRLNLD